MIADRHDAALREADEIIRQAKRRKFALTASKKDSARLTSVQQSISTNFDALVDSPETTFQLSGRTAVGEEHPERPHR